MGRVLSCLLIVPLFVFGTLSSSFPNHPSLKHRNEGSDDLAVFCRNFARDAAAYPSRHTKTVTVTLTSTSTTTAASKTSTLLRSTTDTVISGIDITTTSSTTTATTANSVTSSTTSTKIQVVTVTVTKTTTVSVPGFTRTTTTTTTSYSQTDPVPQRRKRKRSPYLTDLYKRVPPSLRLETVERAAQICRRGTPPPSETCTTAPAAHTGPMLNCGTQGVLKKINAISHRHIPGPVDRGLIICRNACLDNQHCISFEWDTNTKTCRLLAEKLIAQSYNKKIKNGVIHYNRYCFDIACTITTTTTKLVPVTFVTSTTSTETSLTTIPSTTSTTTALTRTVTTTTTTIVTVISSTSTSSTTSFTTTLTSQTGPSTTTQTSTTTTVAVSYSKVNSVPSSGCVYNRESSTPPVSNDPGPNGNYAAAIDQCASFCTRDPTCKMFFYDRYDPAHFHGFDGAECYLDTSPFDPAQMQCVGSITQFSVAYNKNP